MQSVGELFTSKISRGIEFYFSWLDATAEKDFASAFDIPESDMPVIAVLNPGKRKRFLLHEGAIDAAAITTTLEKILGGDARFKTIKGNKMPELVSMYPTE